MGDHLATITREPPLRLIREPSTAALPRTALERRRERARAALTGTIPLVLLALTVVTRVWAPDLVLFGEAQALALDEARRVAGAPELVAALSGSATLSAFAFAYPIVSMLPWPVEAWIGVRAVLDGVAAVLVFVAARSLGHTSAGVVAALLFGLSPWAWGVSRDPAAATLPVLAAGGLLALIRAVRVSRIWWGLIAGLLVGLLVRLDPAGWAIVAALATALVVARPSRATLDGTLAGLVFPIWPVVWSWTSQWPAGLSFRPSDAVRTLDILPVVRPFSDLLAGIGAEPRMVGVATLPAPLTALAVAATGCISVLILVGAWRTVELARGERREAVVPLVWTVVPGLIVLCFVERPRPDMVHTLLPAAVVLAALAAAPVGRWSSRVAPVSLVVGGAAAAVGGTAIVGLLSSALALARSDAPMPYAEWAEAESTRADGAVRGELGVPGASLRFWQAVAADVREASERTGQPGAAVLGGGPAVAGASIVRSLLGGDIAVRTLPPGTVVLPVQREAVYLILPGQEVPPELAWPSARLGSISLPPTDGTARVVTLRPRPTAHWLALHGGGEQIRFADGTVLLAARAGNASNDTVLADLVWLTEATDPSWTGSRAAQAVITVRVDGGATREVRAALPEPPSSGGPELVVQRASSREATPAKSASLSVRLVSGSGQPIHPVDRLPSAEGGVEILRLR